MRKRVTHAKPITRQCLAPLLFPAVLAGAFGCAGEAALVKDTPEGGLVTYAFQTEGEVLTSSARREALGLIAEKCPNGSRIVREGEMSRLHDVPHIERERAQQHKRDLAIHAIKKRGP